MSKDSYMIAEVMLVSATTRLRKLISYWCGIDTAEGAVYECFVHIVENDVVLEEVSKVEGSSVKSSTSRQGWDYGYYNIRAEGDSLPIEL